MFKLAGLLTLGIILVLVAVTGKLGSVLGSIIDPSNMQDFGGNLASEQGPVQGGITARPGQLPTSGTLSPQQIGYYASRAGFSGQNLVIAIAVALAESGGRIDELNTANSNGSTDRGLWQINSVHSQFQAQRLLTDPSYNAMAAFQIWGGSGWFAWTSFNNGRYQRFLNDAQKAVQQGVA